jgi:hypothetical protein
MDSFFSEDDIIHSYSRKEAVEDGFQVDANIGDLAEVTKQHFKWPVYMSRHVFDLMEKAVNNPRWGNDYKGVWHDILTMSNARYREINKGTREFQVIIRGAGHRQIYTMVAQVVPMDIDDAQPVIYISLKGED